MTAGRNNRAQWIAGLVEAARIKGVAIASRELERRLACAEEPDWVMALERLAPNMGIRVELVQASIAEIPAALFPLLAELDDGSVAVARRRVGDVVVCAFPAVGGIETEIPLSDLPERATGRIGLVEPEAARGADARIQSFLRPPPKSWLPSVLLHDKRGYGEIVLASFVGNLLTFGTSLFAMQVWDRVIPAQSIPTLWVLTIGVVVALAFELMLRTARASIADRIGKNSDLVISSRVFARALDLRNHARPRSTGAFVAQLRDIEQVRELLTSTSIVALADLPFVLLFLAFFATLAGPLVIVLVVVLVLILIPGVLLQFPLSRLTREGMREAALRNALLVEAVERVEEIKALQAEPRFQALWERFTESSARVGVAQRACTMLYMNWTQSLQQLAYAAVLVGGVYLVLSGEMTMGALIACAILTNRAIVLFMPLGQVFARWQSARAAMAGLDDLLAKPVDHDPERRLVRRPLLRGEYRFEDLVYAYEPDGAARLRISRLSIRAGERVAVLGRIGSGKSTLLRLLAGMAPPTAGKLLLDGIDIGLIHPADVRRETGYLSQLSELFRGTVRENLLMGAPEADDEAILEALGVAGGLALLQSQSAALDLMLHEGGEGLSGGQKQTLLLARTLLRQTNILLLDEPSAPMDEATERQFVQGVGAWLGERTLVVATNRAGVLDLVDRVVVLDSGRVVMDGPKAKMLAALSESKPEPARLRPVTAGA